jgi:hypothetical protein
MKEDDVIGAAIDEVVREFPKAALERLLEARFTELGIKVKPAKLRAAAEHIMAGNQGDFSFGSKLADAADIELTEADFDSIVEKTEAFLKDDVPGLLKTLADSSADGLYNDLEKNWTTEHPRQLKDVARFKRNLEVRYGLGLNKLRMLDTIATEWGQETYVRKIRAGNGELSHLDDVLLRLHVRACQVTTEIVVLLSTGLADGAMARWRALHEIVTVAMVISKYGVDVAERYVKYQIVESKKALTAYKECYDDLGYEPYDPKQEELIKKQFSELIAEYGEAFQGGYGWIAHLLGEGPNKRVTFGTLQKAAGMGFMRAHYQMASYNVHAGPKGVYFKLGRLDNESKILLAGMSNAGLVEPAQNAAISLGKITLLVCNDPEGPAFDNNVFVKVVDRLSREIPELFASADRKLKLDNRYLRRFGQAPNEGRFARLRSCIRFNWNRVA